MSAAPRPAGAIARLDALARAEPEWAAWLRVVREAASELSDPAWKADATRATAASARDPWLSAATLSPDGRAVAGLLERLIGAARAHGLHALAGDATAERQTSPDEALAVFLAAVNGDAATLDRQAAAIGAAAEGWRTLAGLLPMPFLHGCARHWAASGRAGWSQGYCPVCGAWPAFAEVHGIDRARHLRCGRCGAGWPMPALACTYCASTDHDALGTLVVDGRRSKFSLEVCRGCSGYLKSCTTLQATPSDEVLAVDLESVEFDLVAIEHGFLRPPGQAVALDAVLPGAGRPPAPASTA